MRYEIDDGSKFWNSLTDSQQIDIKLVIEKINQDFADVEDEVDANDARYWIEEILEILS